MGSISVAVSVALRHLVHSKKRVGSGSTLRGNGIIDLSLMLAATVVTARVRLAMTVTTTAAVTLPVTVTVVAAGKAAPICSH